MWDKIQICWFSYCQTILFDQLFRKIFYKPSMSHLVAITIAAHKCANAWPTSGVWIKTTFVIVEKLYILLEFVLSLTGRGRLRLEPRVRPDVRPAPAGDAQPAGGAGGEEPPAVEVNNRLPGTENLVVPLASVTRDRVLHLHVTVISKNAYLGLSVPLQGF